MEVSVSVGVWRWNWRPAGETLISKLFNNIVTKKIFLSSYFNKYITNKRNV
jgi:hypothetical protein